MTRLRDETLVECSIAETRVRLDAFLASLQARDGIRRLRLRVPISPAASRGFAIDREVRVEVRPKHDDALDADVVEIAWKPEGTTIFPPFEGTLAVVHDHTADRAILKIDGTYTPPFGAAGQAFDATIGRQIAVATAREFLRDLKRAIEGPGTES